MATSITGAERLPDADYTVSHRTPPVPSRHPYPSAPAPNSPPLPLNDTRSTHASEAGSVISEHRRRGSLSFLRRSSSHNKASQEFRDSSDVPPVPTVPATRIAQAQQQAGLQASSNPSRKISGEGRTMLRKSSKIKQAERERAEAQRLASLHAPPPVLPSHNPLSEIPTFGGDDSSSGPNFSRPGNAFAAMQNSSSSPAYAVSPPESRGRPNGEYVTNSMERTESMTNRGRYSYASSMVNVNVSSPRRIRRRKDPTPFNVLVIGAKNSGKTSFISFLRHSLALPSSNPPTTEPNATINTSKSSFTSHYLESEIGGERMGLTLWDSAGLEKNIVDLQLREMAAFVESKFEETFVEEQKVMRSPGVKDTHIHCVFLVLDPVRLDATVAAALQTNGANLTNVSGLDDDLDLQAMRALWGKTTVIPVISKADTLTTGHMSFLKRAVWESIKKAKLDPMEALELEDDIEEEDEEDEENSDQGYGDVIDNLVDDSGDDSDLAASKSRKSHARQSSLSFKSNEEETPYIPMSILSPDPYDLPPYAPKSKSAKPDKVGRRFPWGFADPYDAEHCDFTRLRDSIFSEWRGDLRDLSKSKWYENWRTSRLKNVPGSKQRIRGGVTPITAVPREGKTSPTSNRNFSAGSNGVSAVPRSVSNTMNAAMASPTASRPSQATGSYRGMETYQ